MVHSRETVVYQCPTIDKVINSANTILKLISDREKELQYIESCEDESSVLSEIYDNIRHLPEVMEGIRSACEDLREWAIREAEGFDLYEEKVGDLEDLFKYKIIKLDKNDKSTQ